jgi:hypothetical protein
LNPLAQLKEAKVQLKEERSQHPSLKTLLKVQVKVQATRKGDRKVPQALLQELLPINTTGTPALLLRQERSLLLLVKINLEAPRLRALMTVLRSL